MSEPIHCFLDESGDPHFPPGESGRSTYYVLAAVIVADDKLDAVREQADAVRRKHYGDGEMKAGKRSRRRDAERRKAVVEALVELDVSFAAISVDKSALLDDGPLAKWKKSFLKHTARQLLRRLYGTHDNVRVVADEYGRANYQAEFDRYVRARMGLFAGGSDFAFGDSKTEPLIQVADFVAGTVLRAQRDRTDEDRALLGLFRPRMHTYMAWPTVFTPVEPPRRAGEQAVRDQAVRDLALNAAARYLDANRDSRDPVTIARVVSLDRLFFAAQFDEASSFVHADELNRQIAELGLQGVNLSPRWLSANVIGPLRDEGVVISGSPQGYAIPYRADDLDAHARDVKSKAVPMLRRLARYRQDLSIRSAGTVDLLDANDLAELRRLVDTLNELPDNGSS